MKVLSQNKQKLVNLDNTFSVVIDSGEDNSYPKIIAISNMGVKQVLGIYMPNEVQSVLEELLSSTDGVFNMPQSIRFSCGNPLSESNIIRISENFSPSKHSIDRMLERGLLDKIPPKEELMSMLKNYILNSQLSFWNNDGTCCIAVDNTHYFVVQYVYTLKTYSILTYIQCSNGTVKDYQKFVSLRARGK